MTTPKSFAIAITAVLLVALVVRLAVAVHYDAQPRTDAADYDSIGVSLADGGGFPDVRWGPEPVASAFRPPLYPVALGGIYEISGTSDAGRRWEAARVVQALLGVAAVALIGLIALRIWGRPEAVAASAIAAVYPPLLLVGSTLVSEALFIPLVLLGIWMVLRYRDDARLRWLVLAGLCSGLVVLCRSNGALVALALAFGVWILRPRWSWSALVAPAAVIGVAALVVLPWTIRNAVELDAFVPSSTQDGFAIAGQYNGVSENNGSRWLPPNGVPAYRHFFRERGLDEAGLDSDLRGAGLEFALDHPGHILAAGFRNTLRLLNLDDPIALERQAAADLGQPDTVARLSVYGFWLLAAVAILGCLAGAATRIPLFIWLVAAAIFVSVMFIAGLTRYRTPADFLLILLAAPAITWVWRRVVAGPAPGPA